MSLHRVPPYSRETPHWTAADEAEYRAQLEEFYSRERLWRGLSIGVPLGLALLGLIVWVGVKLLGKAND